MQEWYRRFRGWLGVDSSASSTETSMIEEPDLIDSGAESTEQPGIDAKMLVTMVMSIEPDEIDCDEFFAQMDRFVELDLAGEDVAALMPLVYGHAERCRDCREEYEALRRALEAVE